MMSPTILLNLITTSLILNAAHAQNSTAVASNTTLPQNTTTQLTNVTLPSNLTAQNYLIPIYSVKFNVSEAKIPELTKAMIVRSPFNTLITTEDVLILLSSQNMTLPKLQQIDYEHMLAVANLSLFDVLNNASEWASTSRNIMKILESFNIDYFTYLDYMKVADDDGLWRLLKAGNYSDSRIQSALNILNQTEEQIIQKLKPVIRDGLIKQTLPQILNNTAVDAKHILSQVNLSLNSIYENQGIAKMLKNFTDTINAEIFWATALSINSLKTVRKAVDVVEPFSQYVDVTLKNIENRTVTRKANIYPSVPGSLITVDENLESYINVSTNYSNAILNDCQYLIEVGGSLKVHNVTNATQQLGSIIRTENPYGLVHRLGSPLICRNFYHGFLISQNESSLNFLTFQTIETDKPTVPPVSTVSTTTNATAGGDSNKTEENGVDVPHVKIILLLTVIIKTFLF